MKHHIALNVYRLALAWLAVILAPIALAQTSSVELLGTVTAAQASSGLGFNLDEDNEWEWAAAASAGATYARIQCSWDIVEQQTAPPNNTAAATQYVEAPQCLNAFAYASKYGIMPIVVAGYGPPYHKILGVTVPSGASAGATSLTIELQDGTGGDSLANIVIPYDYFCPAASPGAAQTPPLVCASYITDTHSPEGSLVRAVTMIDSTHATITLASALTVSLPASDSALYNISEILYPSAATETATDPSIVAYANYVSFLASDMAAHGLKGQIEIWNEPPWSSDPWDNKCALYDDQLAPPCPNVPGSMPNSHAPNYGFVANLQQRTMPSGITLTWNGTSGSGWASILGPRMLAQSGASAKEPATVVTEESFHPYGFEPEEMMWTTACLEATASATTHNAQNIDNCYLPGEPQTSNFSWAVQADMIAKASNPAYGTGHEITETGILPPVAGLQVQQARFIMRQFIGFEADGVTPVNFFKLYDAEDRNDPNFSFIEEAGSTSAYTAKPSYTAISGFMADLSPIRSAPAAPYSAQTLPSVTTYTGTFPLSTVHMVGARSGATENSDAFMVWQRSFVPCSSANVCGVWITQPSPAAAPVTITIPASMKVTQVVNLTSRDIVSYTASGNTITFEVADDPIEVLADPASSSSISGVLHPTQLSLGTSNASSTYGNPVSLTAVLTPYKSGSNSTNGESVVFLSGSTQLGMGTLSSGVATLQTSAILAGTNTILAEYAGDTHFSASSGYTSVQVAKANPALAIPTIAAQTYGAAAFTVTPSTNSPGAVSLTVVSGPAHISVGDSTGGTIVLLGAGTVVLGATQVPTANFNAAPLVTTSFVVNPMNPGLAFESIAAKTYGDSFFTVTAKSYSHGSISYSVASGPATMSGNTVTLTGAGTVVLKASQQANGNFSATTATVSVAVAQAVPAISINGMSNQVFGAAPVPVSITSPSSGSVTYSIVSGPATVQGNAVSLTGAGTVVVGATQAASGNYAAASLVTNSFVVNGQTPTLTFASFPAKSYQDAAFTITATSASQGTVTYSVYKGPATISGSTVTLTGAGTVGIQASQAAKGSYLAANATLNFTVAKINPRLSIAPIPSMTYGAAAFTVTPSTNSPGSVSLTVVSGPAHISVGDSTGGTVVVLGIGTVVLGATQVPTANFNAAPLVTTSFVVNPADPDLAFESISAKTYGSSSPFTVTAKSYSHGSITYSVASGPATMSGNTVTLTGAGTVVLKASQQANGNFSATTATVTLSVAH